MTGSGGGGGGGGGSNDCLMVSLPAWSETTTCTSAAGAAGMV